MGVIVMNKNMASSLSGVRIPYFITSGKVRAKIDYYINQNFHLCNIRALQM